MIEFMFEFIFGVRVCSEDPERSRRAFPGRTLIALRRSDGDSAPRLTRICDGCGGLSRLSAVTSLTGVPLAIQ